MDRRSHVSPQIQPRRRCQNLPTSPGNEQFNRPPEVRPDVSVNNTNVLSKKALGTDRFERFSQCSSMFRALARLITYLKSRQSRSATKFSFENEGSLIIPHPIEARLQAEKLIVANVQQEDFPDHVVQDAKWGTRLAKASAIIKLNPKVDSKGLLRVGGRLDQADLSSNERHPPILPGSHYVATLLVEHVHNEVKHQGRHFTQGMVRSKGFWVIRGKRLINKVIHKCLKCRKPRSKFQCQLMADLPHLRTLVSMCLGHRKWSRAAQEEVLRKVNVAWAVIFTCLAIRAIHIELIECLDTSSFINSLRRFMAIRGPVKQLRCDCGTNFVGARNELQSALSEMDSEAVKTHLTNNGCEFLFNPPPPHASHAGGVLERIIESQETPSTRCSLKWEHNI